MERASLTYKELAPLRKKKLGPADFQAALYKAALHKAREVSKEAGVTDPVALDRIKAGDLRKDPDGNWLFTYG